MDPRRPLTERPASAPRYASRRRPRWGTLVLVAVLHVAALAGLARAFAPEFTADVIAGATSLVSVTITAPPDPETTTPPPIGSPMRVPPARKGARPRRARRQRRKRRSRGRSPRRACPRQAPRTCRARRRQ